MATNPTPYTQPAIPRHVAARHNLWVDTRAGLVMLNGDPLTVEEAQALAEGLTIGARALRVLATPRDTPPEAPPPAA